jgi:hypothetical protein
LSFKRNDTPAEAKPVASFVIPFLSSNPRDQYKPFKFLMSDFQTTSANAERQKLFDSCFLMARFFS